ncbi:MAG: hypothetical protein IJ868_05285 [Prevotella sp.]|nr:hypothetical protein [Prevotella sp.]
MANNVKIKQMLDKGNPFYPLTILQAVIDPSTRKSMAELLEAITEEIGGLSDDGDSLSERITTLENWKTTLTTADADNVINTFNEIVAFLNGLGETDTLQALLASIGSQIAAKYTKPGTGIPKSDLASDVQTTLDNVGNKADKTATVSTVAYDATNKKVTKTINGTTSDVVTAAKIVLDGGGTTTGAAGTVDYADVSSVLA